MESISMRNVVGVIITRTELHNEKYLSLSFSLGTLLARLFLQAVRPEQRLRNANRKTVAEILKIEQSLP